MRGGILIAPKDRIAATLRSIHTLLRTPYSPGWRPFPYETKTYPRWRKLERFNRFIEILPKRPDNTPPRARSGLIWERPSTGGMRNVCIDPLKEMAVLKQHTAILRGFGYRLYTEFRDLTGIGANEPENWPPSVVFDAEQEYIHRK